MDALVVGLVSDTNAQNYTWPRNVTLHDLDLKLEKLQRLLGGSEVIPRILIHPLLLPPSRRSASKKGRLIEQRQRQSTASCDWNKQHQPLLYLPHPWKLRKVTERRIFEPSPPPAPIVPLPYALQPAPLLANAAMLAVFRSNQIALDVKLPDINAETASLLPTSNERQRRRNGAIYLPILEHAPDVVMSSESARKRRRRLQARPPHGENNNQPRSSGDYLRIGLSRKHDNSGEPASAEHGGKIKERRRRVPKQPTSNRLLGVMEAHIDWHHWLQSLRQVPTTGPNVEILVALMEMEAGKPHEACDRVSRTAQFQIHNDVILPVHGATRPTHSFSMESHILLGELLKVLNPSDEEGASTVSVVNATTTVTEPHSSSSDMFHRAVTLPFPRFSWYSQSTHSVFTGETPYLLSRSCQRMEGPVLALRIRTELLRDEGDGGSVSTAPVTGGTTRTASWWSRTSSDASM